MGTDIHGVLQARYVPKDGREASRYFHQCDIEDDRNYMVFAILAGVRNGSGFAGVPTHEPITPISEPRGLPQDLHVRNDCIYRYGYVSDDYYKKYPEEAEKDLIYLGDHSYSWLSLEECLAYDWTQKTERCGVISRKQYKTLNRETGPSEWSGDIAGKDIVVIDEIQDNIVAKDWTHIRVYWTVEVASCVKTFSRWLHYAAAKCEGMEARIVFGFDS